MSFYHKFFRRDDSAEIRDPDFIEDNTLSVLENKMMASWVRMQADVAMGTPEVREALARKEGTKALGIAIAQALAAMTTPATPMQEPFLKAILKLRDAKALKKPPHPKIPEANAIIQELMALNIRTGPWSRDDLSEEAEALIERGAALFDEMRRDMGEDELVCDCHDCQRKRNKKPQFSNIRSA